MKRAMILFFVVPFFCTLMAQTGGLLTQNPNIAHFQHDPIRGFKTLQKKAAHNLSVAWNQANSTPSYVTGRLTDAGYSVSAEKAADGIRFLSENKELFGLREPEKELKAVSSFTDQLAMTHIKYQQSVNNVRIYYSDVIVHFNSDGSIESVNGSYIPTPEISTVPAISSVAAISAAETSLKNYHPAGSTSELVVYQKNNTPLLAYEVKLPSGAYPNMTLIVDASTGKVLKTDDGIRYDGPAHGTGIGLHGEVRNVETFIWNNKNYLLDATLPMYLSPISGLKGVISTYDALNDTTEDGYLKIELVSDPNGDGNFNDNERLRAAVDAQVFSKMVYEFYSTHFGRNSFDNNGNTIKNVLHYKMNYNNAFWNGEFMSYGDGDGVLFSNLAGGLDVIAHEITHGVTERTAGLVYELQPGAINESISDVFASLLDSTNWQIGEDIYTPATPGDALRNMQDPHNGGIADDLSSGWQPAHMSEYRVMENNEKHDHGGVHMNSGIPNKAFYNVASVIGHWKAGRIWYRSLTTYLTKNAQFTDLREACLNSANDLYGKESEEYKTVVNAFDAVGVNPSEPGNITELLYDDGDASTGLYEKDANFQLAVKFTPPTSDSEIQSIRILLHGDANKNGNGHFSLVMYDDNGTGGLPGSKLINPYSYTPAGVGWQSFTISGVTVKNNFYVGMLYDGTNQPLVGADNPPGNERTYEYNPASGTWYNLTGSDNYTVFIRATIKSTTTDVEIDPKVPDKFALMQNYPNPFNPSTTIKYSLPASSDVEIIVYDAAGRQVAELVNNSQNPGTYTVTWNGKNDMGAPVSSGIYFYRFKAGSFVQTNKMILLK